MRYMVLVLLVGLLICGCTDSTAAIPATGQPAAVSAERFAVPGPAEFTRGVQAEGVDEVALGGQYLLQFRQLIDPVGTTAVFMPDYPLNNQGPHDLAYAAYNFHVTPADGFARLDLDWAAAPQRYWLGLSDYTRDRWVWFEPASDSLALPASLADYLDSDFMLVMVAAIGTSHATLTSLTLAARSTAGLTNLFFLHHSVGDGVVTTGNMRFYIDQYNTDNGTSFEFWDHGYYEDGLRGPDGADTGTDYGYLTSNTDPPDLHNLWTSPDGDWAALRNTILANHEVIAFKSCYPASDIWDDSELQQRKSWYLAMRTFFDTRPDRLFVVLTTPPLEPGATNAGNAGRAREFADWLTSGEYLSGHPNVVCFDIFNLLAELDDGSPEANTLRVEYRSGDSHPNATGYAAVGPEFAQFLCVAAAAH